jgi:hypothetical protein
MCIALRIKAINNFFEPAFSVLGSLRRIVQKKGYVVEAINQRSYQWHRRNAILYVPVRVFLAANVCIQIEQEEVDAQRVAQHHRDVVVHVPRQAAMRLSLAKDRLHHCFG